MFSSARLTRSASRAISPIASSVNARSTPSAPSRARYCLSSAFSGSRRMRTKSSSRERVELDADREPALELGDQVRRLRDVERAGGDEEHVIGLDGAVLGVDRRALDDRQQVALHALARDVGPAAARLAPGDLVDLVEEDDAGLPRRARRASRATWPGSMSLALLLRLQDLARLRRLSSCGASSCPPKRPGSISLTLMSISSTPLSVTISKDGNVLSATSTSTRRSSSLPSRRRVRRRRASSPRASTSVSAGSRRSSSRCSVRASARSRISASSRRAPSARRPRSGRGRSTRRRGRRSRPR